MVYRAVTLDGNERDHWQRADKVASCNDHATSAKLIVSSFLYFLIRSSFRRNERERERGIESKAKNRVTFVRDKSMVGFFPQRNIFDLYFILKICIRRLER